MSLRQNTNNELRRTARTSRNTLLRVGCWCRCAKTPTTAKNYRKTIIIYDKNGEVLGDKTIAYESQYQNSTKALTCTINADNSFYIKNFVKRNGRKDEWILSKKEDFVITSAGKIEQKP